MIIDDKDGQRTERIWNIYYHLLLDADSLSLLRAHAKKLKDIASTVEEWHDGVYGRLLRFGNSSTFFAVRRLWESYATEPKKTRAFNAKHGLEKARTVQKVVMGDGFSLSGVRSAAPCSSLALEDIPRTYKTYWKDGTTTIMKTKIEGRAVAQTKRDNPLIGVSKERLTLHYGTDPLLGYHLATGYAALSDRSPLKPSVTASKDVDRAAKAAITQFRVYGQVFRAISSRMTIRVINADALAFCHVLQHHRMFGESQTAYWYRDNWHYEPLVLDTDDYMKPDLPGIAPTSFEVIDTSNLVDHLGCLNLLAATSPLLNQTVTSVLLTEMLVLREEHIDDYAKALLSGDLPTVALVFGLMPIQYWTHASATSVYDETLMGLATAGSSEKQASGQSRFVVIWKSVGLSSGHTRGSMRTSNGRAEADTSLTFEAHDLARLLYRMYLNMFQDESWANRLAATRESLVRKAYEHYTRASFSAILSLIKASERVEWERFIEQLIDLVLNDQELNMGAHYLQSLFVHLHMFGLHSMPTYEPKMDGIVANVEDSPLRGWQDLPSVLCMTLVVPHQNLAAFQNSLRTDIGSPICHLMLQSPDGRQNIFPDIQLGFGRVKTSGVRYTGSFRVQVEADDMEWEGSAPLLVSTMVPTWVLLLYPDCSTEVIFQLKNTPMALLKLGRELGMFLALQRSTLASDDVFITKHRPHMLGHMSVCCATSTKSVTLDEGNTLSRRCVPKPEDYTMKTTFHVQLHRQQSALACLTTHLDLLVTKHQDLLRGGAIVNISQLSSFTLAIDVGSGALWRRVSLPVPLQMTGGKVRIARKSSYVEFIAPIASPQELSGRAECLFPILLTNDGRPALQNLHYVNLNRLPTLAVEDSSSRKKLKWLNPHLSSMWSARERMERQRFLRSALSCGDVRVNFKDSLFSLFMHFTGLEANGARHSLFGIHNSGAGGVHLLIFASCLRLDMSNQTVVLDAAAMPLTPDLVVQFRPLIYAVQKRGMMCIEVDDAELLLWKRALPAFVERCRDWEHGPACEYVNRDKPPPLSVGFGDPIICSCGFGKFPGNGQLHKELSGKICAHVVRVAIPPCFHVSFVEQSHLKSLSLSSKAKDQKNRPSDLQRLAGSVEDLTLKEGTCFTCGKEKKKPTAGSGGDGGLLKCGGCLVAEYCSKECQVKDWKEGGHKKLCAALKNS